MRQLQSVSIRLAYFITLGYLGIHAEEPTLSSVLWDGFAGQQPTPWQIQNRVIDRISFSHNMQAVFLPDDFKVHPEWLPWVNGAPQAPETVNSYLWQPDLTNLTLVPHTVNRVLHFFEANPDKLSFSLGMNDTTNFGDPASNSPLTTPRRWFRGRPDYSDLVFTYTNAVAEQVAVKYPDKYIGALAYYWHENVPTFPVHPNVVPYLCADRTQYYDVAFKVEDLELIRKWGRAGPKFIGLYDYWYGHPFIVPRITFQAQSDAIAVARESGVRAWFVEMNPIQGFDAGKLWLTAQLMNRPEADAHALLAEFYQNYYGSTAVPMQEFFESCETIWMSQPGKARWLKYYKDIQQVRLFPLATCNRLSALLDIAYQQADSTIIGERIEQTRSAFAATTAVSHYWHAVTEAERVAESVGSVQLAVGSLNQNFASSPHSTANCKLQTVNFTLFSLLKLRSAAKLALKNAVDKGNVPMASMEFLFSDDLLPRLAKKLRIGAGDISAEQLQQNPELATALRLDRLTPLRKRLRGGDFELGQFVQRGSKSLEEPTGWKLFAREAEYLAVTLRPESAHSGNVGMRVEGADALALGQWVRTAPDESLQFSGWLRGAIDPSSRVRICLEFSDAEGRTLFTTKCDRFTGNYSSTQWVELVVYGKAPVGAVWVRCNIFINSLYPGQWVEVDDFSLMQLVAA
ncbi:MAG: DUF4838 domain-containing protein [Verrucomicrobiota bacterium]|nr:DUF4838 domain-containing protein [Verrucomicrobiota bacterium]